MSKFAIKGHSTRGKEIIEILQMLGGINKYNITYTEDNLWYCLRSKDNVIIATYPNSSIKTVLSIEEFLEKFPYKVGDKVQRNGATSCGSIYVIEQMKWEDNQVKHVICDLYWKNCKCTVISKDLQPYKEETMDKANKVVFDSNAQCCDIMNHLIKEETMEEIIKIDIPEGYEFAGVDGDNHQVVFEKICCDKYPKTYEKCCEISEVQYEEVYFEPSDFTTIYERDLERLLVRFRELIICRDTYWKIAGEQMGLGKPWEPDWLNIKQDKYVLYTHNNSICSNCFMLGNNILAFPTEEMRDAFYENFKELIESCKELL